MKGTIDPVEAIFTAVSGLWGRVFGFLGASWLGFAVGIMAAEATWTYDFWAETVEAAQGWYFVPISWIFGCAASCLRWWGLLHLLVLIVIGFKLIYSEANVCLSVCILFLIESWLWWAVQITYFHFSPESSHPFLYVMIVLSAGALWLGWHAWKSECLREESDDIVQAHTIPSAAEGELPIKSNREGMD